MPEIELNLRKHCIETAIKRFHNYLLSEYFKSRGGNAVSEEKLVMLEKALTCFDFSSLRTLHGELAGESDARVILTANGDSTPGITIDGHIVDMEHFIRE